jgi:hypothetical protein
LVLEVEEIRSVVESDGRVKIRRVNGKQYLYLVYPDGSERCAGRLGRYPEDVRRRVGSIRRSRAGARGKGGQGGSMASVQTQTQGQQLVSTRVEGGRIIVEREVELETMWSVGRIAYAQKYLGYPGSFGEFVSDCTILFFKGEVEVALKSPEAD